jgi:hypothetical protein
LQVNIQSLNSSFSQIRSLKALLILANRHRKGSDGAALCLAPKAQHLGFETVIFIPLHFCFPFCLIGFVVED